MPCVSFITFSRWLVPVNENICGKVLPVPNWIQIVKYFSSAVFPLTGYQVSVTKIFLVTDIAAIHSGNNNFASLNADQMPNPIIKLTRTPTSFRAEPDWKLKFGGVGVTQFLTRLHHLFWWNDHKWGNKCKTLLWIQFNQFLVLLIVCGAVTNVEKKINSAENL